MWELYPEFRADIEELANEVREIADKFGIEALMAILKLSFIRPETSNDTDIIIAAGHLGYALQANGFQKQATKEADKLYGENPADGTEHNAFKHSYWTSLTSYFINPEYARLASNAHEFGARDNLTQSEYPQKLFRMDLHNNSMGIELGKSINWYCSDADAKKTIINTLRSWIRDRTLVTVN